MCKSRPLGGKGFPDLNLLLMAKFVCAHVELCVQGECKAALFVRFFIGAVLRTFKWYKVPLTVPTAWEVPFHYGWVKNFILKYELSAIEVEVLKEYKKVIGLVQGKDTICPVSAHTEGVVKVLWGDVAPPKLFNVHKDLSWMVAHNIVPVRQFIHSRRLRDVLKRAVGLKSRCITACGSVLMQTILV